MHEESRPKANSQKCLNRSVKRKQRSMIFQAPINEPIRIPQIQTNASVYQTLSLLYTVRAHAWYTVPRTKSVEPINRRMMNCLIRSDGAVSYSVRQPSVVNAHASWWVSPQFNPGYVFIFFIVTSAIRRVGVKFKGVLLLACSVLEISLQREVVFNFHNMSVR